MVQLEILSGKAAGTKWVARRFPVRVGRLASSDLRLEEPGVWDKHLQIIMNPAVGFVLETESPALAVANGQPVERIVLRNGDTIEVGAVKFRFWLSEAEQRGSKIQEGLVWIILIAISLGQVALIYWLIQ
jgi:pSer/pThr/pTyr-binding forkhead associated (FHA) protein